MLSAVPRPRPPAVIAFLAVAAGVFFVAFEDGAYDLVTRHQGGVLVWWLLALAVLAGLLPRTLPGRAGTLAVGALAAMAVWSTIGLAWTSSDERTSVEIARTLVHLGVLILAGTALGPSSWRAAIAGAAAGAAAVCALAVLSRLDPGTFGADAAADAFGINRLSRPIGYWNALGAWAGMTAALGLGLGAHARHPVARAAATAIVPLAAATAYLTYSRASVGGTVLGVLVLLVVSRNRWTLALHTAAAAAGAALVILTIRDHPEIAQATGTAGAGAVAPILVGAMIGAGVVAAVSGLAGSDRVRLPRTAGRVAGIAAAAVLVVATAGAIAANTDRIEDSLESAPLTAEAGAVDDPAARLTNLSGTRPKIWEVAGDGFRADPWTGSGPGTFEFVWSQSDDAAEFIRDGHSLYLETLSEQGIPGFLLLLGFVAGIAWAAAGTLRAFPDGPERGAAAAATAALAAFLFGAGVDWLWEATAVTVLALVLLGALIAATGRSAPRMRAAVRIPLALVALVAGLLLLPGLVGLSEVRRSQDAAQDGDRAAALNHATRAVEAQPWAASAYVQRALVLEGQGRLKAAAVDLRRAVEHEPENWRQYLLLARVEAERGRLQPALNAYGQAQRLRPSSTFVGGQE